MRGVGKRGGLKGPAVSVKNAGGQLLTGPELVRISFFFLGALGLFFFGEFGGVRGASRQRSSKAWRRAASTLSSAKTGTFPSVGGGALELDPEVSGEESVTGGVPAVGAEVGSALIADDHGLDLRIRNDQVAPVEVPLVLRGEIPLVVQTALRHPVQVSREERLQGFGWAPEVRRFALGGVGHRQEW